MTPSGCIFCGARPTTREHVISRWAAKVVKQDPRGIAEDSRHAHLMVSEGKTPTRREWDSAQPVDFKANCVCSDCNSGWMEQIETAARRVVAPMIRGETVILSRADQDNVTRWLTLKAIIERHCRSPIIPMRADWIEHFRKELIPPTTWQVRIARWIGRVVVNMSGGDFEATVSHPLVPFAFRRPGLLFTLGIGQFLGQVIGVDYSLSVSADRNLFIQIWPHPLLRSVDAEASHDDLITWPAEHRLDDADLRRYSRNPAR